MRCPLGWLQGLPCQQGTSRCMLKACGGEACSSLLEITHPAGPGDGNPSEEEEGGWGLLFRVQGRAQKISRVGGGGVETGEKKH